MPSFPLLLTALAQQQWHLQANDDTPGGWLALALYVVLSGLCWIQFARTRRMSQPMLPASFWFWVSLAVTALGINKQADFHTLVISSGGAFARNEGIFEYRVPIEVTFVGLLALGAGVVTRVLWRLARRAGTAERMVIVGLVALLGFSLVRAAVSSHVDFGGTLPGEGGSLVGVELGILVFLCFAVWCTAGNVNRDGLA